MKHYGDITKIDGADVPIVDIVTGGSPCQDLSVAGRRAGLDGERSGLFMEQIRVIKEMRENDRRNGRTDELVRPRYMVWENVYGAFSSNGGEDFRIVLEETARVADKDAVIPRPYGGGADNWTPSGAVVGDGWSIAWRVHDAQFWGVPQRRKRIALVADFGGESAPEILFERKGVSRDIESCEKQREGTTTAAERGIDKTGGGIAFGICSYDSNSMKSQNPNSGIYKADTSRTIDNNGGNPACNQGGMAVVQGFDGFNLEQTGDKTQTLTAQRTDTKNIPIVTFSQRMPDKDNFNAVISYGFDPTASRDVGALFLKEKAKTCTVGTCPSHRNGVVAYGLDRASFNQGKNAKFDFAVDEEQIGAMTARGPGAVFNSVVRRLTPLECERLQGFPDGWTDIGDWVDSKGKKHKGDADSPRYKALGNSIALPFWQWMAERMVAQYDRPTTMASLFDGIGGFPLVYQRCGCTPVWASEIEEFPIAVTKMRFGED